MAGLGAAPAGDHQCINAANRERLGDPLPILTHRLAAVMGPNLGTIREVGQHSPVVRTVSEQWTAFATRPSDRRPGCCGSPGMLGRARRRVPDAASSTSLRWTSCRCRRLCGRHRLRARPRARAPPPAGAGRVRPRAAARRGPGHLGRASRPGDPRLGDQPPPELPRQVGRRNQDCQAPGAGRAVPTRQPAAPPERGRTVSAHRSRAQVTPIPTTSAWPRPSARQTMTSPPPSSSASGTGAGASQSSNRGGRAAAGPVALQP
jgi:hypothetical protein